MIQTHPILALVLNPPPINRKPLPILLRPRPLNRQIRITHQRLPNVIETVINMVLLGFQHSVVGLVDGTVVHAGFEGEEEGPHVVEAVQLVEDGDVVDFAGAFFVGRLARGERVALRVGDQDEAVAWGREVVSPGFVCFGG